VGWGSVFNLSACSSLRSLILVNLSRDIPWCCRDVPLYCALGARVGRQDDRRLRLPIPGSGADPVGPTNPMAHSQQRTFQL
jgi:hypothetical protein